MAVAIGGTAPTNAKRQLRAIVAADVQSFTELVGIDELLAVERVKAGISLLGDLVGVYGGRVADEIGDGIIAVFPSVHDALLFAVEVQRDFRRGDIWHVGDRPIRFRIGIHVGEVVRVGDKVHGYHVNVASRVEAAAMPGGICVSEHAHRALPVDLRRQLYSLGQRALKNLPEPIEVFAVRLDEPEADLTPQVRRDRQSDRAMPTSEIKVAVMPIHYGGGLPSGRVLGDGFTGDIIVNLSRFREFAVIARESSFAFRKSDEDRSNVAARLGCRYLVTGNLQLADRQLRLQVQLQVGDSGKVLWSERFTGQLQEIFDFQDEVTAQIASRVAKQITAEERRQLGDAYRPELAAYGLILRGHDLSHRYKREANWHARRLFKHASNLDPAYGRSYTGISRALNLAWRYRWDAEPERCLHDAIDMARLAIDYDGLDARAHAELGFAHLYRKEHEDAIGAYERALNLNPNDADIIAEHADALVYDGRPQDAIAKIERAMQLNPIYPDWYLWNLADAYNAMRQPEKVIETVRKMRDRSEGRRLLAANYAHLDMMKEAEDEARELMRAHPEFTVSAWARRPPYKDSDTLAHFMDGLHKAGLPAC